MPTIPTINNLQLDQFDLLGDTSPKQSQPKKAVEGSGSRTTRALDQHQEKLKARTTGALARQHRELGSKILQEAFPYWTDDQRGVPNPFIRSGLFSAARGDKSEKREFFTEMALPSLSNYQVVYTGVDLQQDDLSVWMSLMNLARTRPMSESVYFSGYQLITDLKWSVNSKSYKRAQESISRLKVTGIEIRSAGNEQAYSGSLIREYSWMALDDNGNKRWSVSFEPKVSVLFLGDNTTLLEWEQRRQLGSRATTAQWFHAFYSSHRDPIPMSVTKFHELCRSGDTLSSFKRSVHLALTKLVDIGFLVSFNITPGGQVHVIKKVQAKLIPVK